MVSDHTAKAGFESPGENGVSENGVRVSENGVRVHFPNCGDGAPSVCPERDYGDSALNGHPTNSYRHRFRSQRPAENIAGERR
ncbi:MAG: hypothetical protein FD176_836 [Rhodospirillaceae bacterium]|nr:MAG: hypothetical protein FD176_836 [Rhodospirillaceae bacterium]TNC97900.1 MAG: hypothetical protein FD119_888 [Stygiobacter sp.]